MSIKFIYPEFEVIRNEKRCTNCQRCVSFCPTRALKIIKSNSVFRENANWSNDTIREIYRQTNSKGVLLPSMGSPSPLPVYWDRILINASQVTNLPIDPLHEPMETQVFLGKKPEKVDLRGNRLMLRCIGITKKSLTYLGSPVLANNERYDLQSSEAHTSTVSDSLLSRK